MNLFYHLGNNIFDNIINSFSIFLKLEQEFIFIIIFFKIYLNIKDKIDQKIKMLKNISAHMTAARGFGDINDSYLPCVVFIDEIDVIDDNPVAYGTAAFFQS